MKLISIKKPDSSFVPALIEAGDSDACFPADRGSWTSAMLIRETIDSKNVPGSFSERAELGSVELGVPVIDPQKVICVGKNYADHAKEMGGDAPEIPVIFNKFPSSLTTAGEIFLPGISEKVDYEAELVVVVGRQGKNIAREDAFDHVFGYCCGNDVSARDWQKGRPGGQWLLGKTFDQFAPIGPWIITKDEVPNPNRLDIQLELNGTVVQSSNTCELIFPIDFLIAHISQFCTLEPGDLLFTGTPAGVGAGKNPPVYLKHGDETVVSIEGVGSLRNTFVSK